MLSRRRCVIHIGLPKTGSSSIQAFLRSRTTALLEYGVRFPTPRLEGRGTASDGRIPQFDLLQHFYKLARPKAPQSIDYDQIIEQSRLDPPGSTLLLTHEVQALHGHNARNELFVDLAKTHDITFICYLRSPLSWLASYYEQAISQPNGFFADPARHFAARAYVGKGFHGMIAPFRNLGQVELHDYDALRSDGQLVPGFLHRVGLGAFVQEASAAPRVNTHAYSPEQITIMQQLKREGIDAEFFVRVRNLFDQFNAGSRRKRGPAVLFPQELRQSIERQWEHDRDALSGEVTLTGMSPAPDLHPYRDDAEQLEALVAFSTTAPDAEAAAILQRAVRAG